jgi:hypothetical protein
MIVGACVRLDRTRPGSRRGRRRHRRSASCPARARIPAKSSLRNMNPGPIGERARRGDRLRSIATSAPRRQDDRRTGRAMPENLPTPPKSISQIERERSSVPRSFWPVQPVWESGWADALAGDTSQLGQWNWQNLSEASAQTNRHVGYCRSWFKKLWISGSSGSSSARRVA